MPFLVSGNWAAAGLGVFVFVVAELLTLAIRGREEMRKRWLESVGIGVAAVTAGWVLLFICSVIHTVYQDHEDLVNRIAVLRTGSDLDIAIDSVGNSMSGVKPNGKDEFILAGLHVSNRSVPSTALTDWQIYIALPGGKVQKLPIPALPEGSIEFATGNRNHPHISLDKQVYCPTDVLPENSSR